MNDDTDKIYELIERNLLDVITRVHDQTTNDMPNLVNLNKINNLLIGVNYMMCSDNEGMI